MLSELTKYLIKTILLNSTCFLYNVCYTHLWPFSKSKFKLNSDRVNLVAPASPIECLLYLPNVQTNVGDTVQTVAGKVDPARKFKYKGVMQKMREISLTPFWEEKYFEFLICNRITMTHIGTEFLPQTLIIWVWLYGSDYMGISLQLDVVNLCYF